MMTYRDIIYEDFIRYTFDNGSVLFGNGFINNEIQISVLSSTNPHSQAVGIFFILGVSGIIIFLLIFLKALENTLNSFEYGDRVHFKLFAALSLLMIMDSYFVLTVFPLYEIFIMFYLIKLPDYQRKQAVRKVI